MIRICRISDMVMDIMQPYYYQFSVTESVQCISAPAPYSFALSFAGGVALPLLYFLTINYLLKTKNY